MLKVLIRLDRSTHGSLQSKLREKLSEAISRGDVETGTALPSTRDLARYLKISRNTVTLVYQELADEGVLVSEGRKGFFVSRDASARLPPCSPAVEASTVDWDRRLIMRPSAFQRPHLPADWRTKRYTFTYGQHDRWLFPISNWRKVSRESLSLHDMHDWTVDYVDGDDPMLLDAFRRRVLPRRGFTAEADQILVTVGAQHALQLIAQCLVRPGTVVGVEEPCYPDARNIFALFGARLKPLPVDDQGLVVDHVVAGCDIVYVTPSHQSPTTVTMAPQRRKALLAAAKEHDFVIVEDDYDTESRFGKSPGLALKSEDSDGRVVYLTSLSKLLSPGLRVGFLVAPEQLLREARAYRRLSIRHPAANNQRTVALFLKGGHYESLLKRFHETYEHRWRVLRAELARHFPDARIAASDGGSSIWLRMPEHVNTARLASIAYDRNVHIEPGHPHYLSANPPMNCLRFGFSSILAEDIPAGIQIVADILGEMEPERTSSLAHELT